MTPVLWTAMLIAFGCFALAMLLTMLRLFKGPSAQDRVLALDYLTVNALLLMLVLGMRHHSSMYFEAALLVAMLGFITSMALARFLLRGEIIE
ncbi:K+/H+ antiporter subunit F [Aquincola sp. MAHUQ-54]|uniref:K+/H+ antiporter subunit F n=1 Tax=Aquincola agrisoli TaxID=3119538 RepID=A0AAW9Q491_9BURK